MRRTIKAIVSILLAYVISGNVCANTYSLDNDTNWVVGRTCNWSPYLTAAETNGMTNQTRARTDFNFTQAAKNVIVNSGYAFTFEHRTSEDATISVTDHYSNLPDPHFDEDDDSGILGFGSDGYYEEAEVTCASPEDIVVGKNYYYSTYWSRPSSETTGAFDFITQLSYYLIEYQEVASDYIASLDWYYHGTTTLDSNLTLNKETSSSKEENNRITEADTTIMKMHERIGGITELEEYKSTVDAKYKDLRAKNNEKSISERENREGVNTTAKAVVTFNSPVTINYLCSLLTNGVTLINYEAKFINDENEWITLCSKRLEESDLLEVAGILSGGENLSYCGITSATLEIPVLDNTYERMYEEEYIYLIDMSEYLVMTDKNDYSLHVSVPDCYYLLERTRSQK